VWRGAGVVAATPEERKAMLRTQPSVHGAGITDVMSERVGVHRPSPVARHAFFCLILLLGSSLAGLGQTVGGKVIVHSMFGGQIFGFDIDQNGTEGVLSEAQTLANGQVLAAVETFDQKTGKILAVVAKTQTTGDDFVTMGVVGNSVGLIEHEVLGSLFRVTRKFQVINPLNSNQFTGTWTPPIGSQDIIMPGGVSRSQGVPNVAVFVYDNSGHFTPKVFSSNVAANTFGPVIKITDSNDFGSVPPPIAYDSVTNQAILGGGPGCFFCLPVIGVADLTNATFSKFAGIGFGFINGIAVDAADGIFVTTTEDDANVEFYSLTDQNGFTEQLPSSGGDQFYSGADVEFDPIHKLFFVAQPNSSVHSGSTIYVYDTQGVLKQTLNGFQFSNSSNVVPMHIALNPSKRMGYVDGPDPRVTAIQQFVY
jgi:hypothetical protein